MSMRSHLTTSFLILATSAGSAVAAAQNSGARALIVSLNGAHPVSRGETTAFDVDADGDREDILLPGCGSGLFARDANRNGAIDDGSEVLGAVGGNPIAALALLDANADGFLSSADEAYAGLSIWTQTADGADELVGLSEAGIAFVYLEAQVTDDGNRALGFASADGSIGFGAEISLGGTFEVDPIAECDEGDIAGDCAKTFHDGLGWECDSPGASCTNNQGGAGTCKQNQNFSSVWCTCRGSKMSPLMDDRWLLAFGAVLVVLSTAFGMRSPRLPSALSS